MAAARQQKSAPQLALTIAEFCKAFRISRPFYYVLQKQGRGPVEMRIGPRKTLISMDAADRWRQEQEEKRT